MSPDILRVLPQDLARQRTSDDHIGETLVLASRDTTPAIIALLFDPSASMHLETTRLDGHAQNGRVVVFDLSESNSLSEKQTWDLVDEAVRTLIDYGFHSATIGYSKNINEWPIDDQPPRELPGVFNV